MKTLDIHSHLLCVCYMFVCFPEKAFPDNLALLAKLPTKTAG